MKHRLLSIIIVNVLLSAALLNAEEGDSFQFILQNPVQKLFQTLGQEFPLLAEDHALQYEYEQQFRNLLLKGYTYQDVLARFHQELTLRFTSAEQNREAKNSPMEALRNLKMFKHEQNLIQGPTVYNSAGLTMIGNNSMQKPGKPHR